ncbi:MAG: MFS transporter [Acidimicrobiia bacterium]|nr:MFS transporter [Acidimicrobiia bacterium]
MSTARRVLHHLAHPVQGMHQLAGDGPVGALLILFGLNAVDELDRTAFGILLPEIRDEFGLGFQGMLSLIALVIAAALALQVPIAGLADRYNRIRLTAVGAFAWAIMSFGTGLATTVVFLGITRSGSAIGKAVIDPTHNSLLADWFPPDRRPAVYSFHRSANAVGAAIGPLLAGFLAFRWGWRLPFFLFAFPSIILALMALRLKEPSRGVQERRAMGADEITALTEEQPPSYAEAWRMCWKIATLRRIFVALPFLAASLTGFVSLASLLYEDQFGLDERGRGIAAAATEPAQLLGLIIGATVATRLFAKDPGLVLRFLALSSAVASVLSLVFALAPNIGVAIAANIGISISLAIVGPGVLASLSMVIPPRARAMGFSMGSLWVLPGLILLPFIGWIADNWGIRLGMVLMTPVFLIGGLIIASAGNLVRGDIEQVWKTATARAEVARARAEGRAKLLLCKDLDVSYGPVQVLFGVDFEIDEGEIVALLGTNGAGKSTLLKAIGGVVEADRGAVIFDGRDISHAPPNEVAGHGIVQIPGGQGVFPDLTVRENLDAAGWLRRHHKQDLADDRRKVLHRFPALETRLDSPAGALSGGQQQMLALGMAFLTRPRLLMIDELSLGLAPVVVEELLEMVREFAEAGVTVILVEQSVNVALTLAERAYFMEKGEIRFEGLTSELLERPDVLRSVFLDGAGASPNSTKTNGDRPTPPTPDIDHPPALLVEDLSRSFGGINAVDQVSFSVREGEILGMIGPNGAGKTTLFDLISGFVPSEDGTVHLKHHDLTGKSANQRAWAGLGRSFQDARLFPALTVQESISVALERWIDVRDPIAAALWLPAAAHSEQQVAGRVDELIEAFGLEAFRHKQIRELSTGSRRIVDLACVVAHRPSVVLLDEPSSGIAQRETEALGPVLLRLRDQLECAIVIIEHDMPLVRAVADRLIALDSGTVVVDGDPELVLSDPRVVASYLGTDQRVIERSGLRSN